MINLRFIGVALIFASCATPALAETFDIGVNAPSGALTAQKQWMPLAKYLSEKTGHTYNILPLDPEAVGEAVKTGRADFALANPVISAVAIHKGLAKNIASLEGDAGRQFGGVILAKAGGPSTAAELKGKRIMAFQGKSAGAYVFQMAHLKQSGVVGADLKFLPDAKSQDDIVLAVRAGIADAGFVRTGILEKMAKQGKITMADFVIVDKKDDGFPRIHTTELYPDWQMLVASTGDGAAAAGPVAEALKALNASDTVATTAGIKGFSEPQSMERIVKAMTDLRIPPFDQ